MKPARYIFINRGLGMSPGKIAAQAAHAETLAMYDTMAVETEKKKGTQALFREWYDSGHYTKLTMLAEDGEQLKNIERYLNERGYKTFLVIDEGRTEIQPFSPTALAVELVDRDDELVKQHFGDFRTYKPEKTPKTEYGNMESQIKLTWRERRARKRLGNAILRGLREERYDTAEAGRRLTTLDSALGIKRP